MKQAFCFLGAAVVAAAMAMAQRPAFGGMPSDPAKMAEARVAMLNQALDLTEAQKTQAVKIFTDAQLASEKFRDEIQLLRQEMQTATKASDLASMERCAREIGSATGEITFIDARAQAAFYSILTPEQKTKYDQLPARGFGMGPGALGPGRMRQQE